MTVPAISGRNVILATTVGALLEAKTVVALQGTRALPLHGLQQPLATAPVVLKHPAVAVGFTPENIGKPTARAEHLHRFTVWIWFRLPNLRVMQVHMVAGVINHQAVFFAVIQAKTSAHHLLIQAHRLGGPKYGDQVHMGRIEARGEHRHIHQIL